MPFLFFLLIILFVIFVRRHVTKVLNEPPYYTRPVIEPSPVLPRFKIEPEEESAYKKRFNVMSRSESAFFHELKRQLPSNYYIFPKMRIADMIDAVDGKGFYFRRNKILPKHIDFLVCNEYFEPVVAIEVNGNSHFRADRAERDILVNQIFKNARLPLETVNVGTDFSSSIAKIKDTLYH